MERLKVDKKKIEIILPTDVPTSNANVYVGCDFALNKSKTLYVQHALDGVTSCTESNSEPIDISKSIYFLHAQINRQMLALAIASLIRQEAIRRWEHYWKDWQR